MGLGIFEIFSPVSKIYTDCLYTDFKYEDPNEYEENQLKIALEFIMALFSLDVANI